ncbi:hypothetical protein LXL04_016966 [Taraxacum kok-saghyz]
MALKLPAAEAANVVIQSIGCGYDASLDLRLKYRKRRYLSDFGNNPYRNCRLIEIEEDNGRDIVLPGGLVAFNVSSSIKFDEGEHRRLQSDVLSFQQMSQQFNQELSLDKRVPLGFFNSMFEFSGNSQKDASSTKTLAFDGVFISLYTVALEETQIVLCDHVKKAVPSSWEPALLARFIKKFGTHIIVGVKMGGKDVIYIKQNHDSSLESDNVQKKLELMGDERFLESYGKDPVDLVNISQINKDLVIICKRRGGSDDKNLKHNEWLNTVKLEPDVITMSFVPITSLLNGVSGRGYLSHAISLYLRYKPPIEELHRFLDFQSRIQWAPAYFKYHYLSNGSELEQQSSSSLQFSFFGPKLYVNTNLVEVGFMPVTGLRLYLNGEKNNHLEIHMQHLSSFPKSFRLDESTETGILNYDSKDRRFYEKVNGNNFDHVCTAPVESGDEFSIVTGAQLQVGNYGLKKVLFLRLHFSKLLGCTTDRVSEWDESPCLNSECLISFAEVLPPKHEVPNTPLFDPRTMEVTRKLLKFVNTMEITRGMEDSPGYWVVTGARLVVDKGKICLRVKYSLPRMLADDQVVD